MHTHAHMQAHTTHLLLLQLQHFGLRMGSSVLKSITSLFQHTVALFYISASSNSGNTHEHLSHEHPSMSLFFPSSPFPLSLLPSPLLLPSSSLCMYKCMYEYIPLVSLQQFSYLQILCLNAGTLLKHILFEVLILLYNPLYVV